MNQPFPPASLTERDAATYIGMSAIWLRKSRSKGNKNAPPFARIGRSIRYLVKDLDLWLEIRKAS